LDRAAYSPGPKRGSRYLRLWLIFVESSGVTIDRPYAVLYDAKPMENHDLDDLQRKYKEAVDRLVGAIRAEEAPATADHSETAWEKWDQADFAVQDAIDAAKDARDHYKDGLRALHFDM
jgi:hypothetical protein